MVLAALRQRAAGDLAMADRLAYVRAFRIVPTSRSLRAGRVRDVASGLVFVHRRWTNDPGLIAGQALRRGLRLFDPRYLRRPFCYRSEANRLMTRWVLDGWRYCPAYAAYQFGHEIKAGRYILCFALLRRLGWAIERPLWGEGELRADLAARQARGERPSAATIAERYTLPPEYVAEVLLAGGAASGPVAEARRPGRGHVAPLG